MIGLSYGETTPLNQNEVYGLPPGLCFVLSSVAIEHSADGTTWTAFTGANTVGAQTAAKFIRCTTGAAQARCVRP